jgi:hypothetical protein
VHSLILEALPLAGKADAYEFLLQARRVEEPEEV